MSEENKDKTEVLYFYCEESLKTDFYKMTQEKNLSPGLCLELFMRKAVKNWEAEKKKALGDEENNE